jgi:lipoprotein-releasing system ATP-binding protein
MNVVLEARGLTRVLPGPQPTMLVNDVDAQFEAGSFTAITGPSGSGKSSLLYLLGLLDPPTRGDVLIEGISTRSLDNETWGRIRLKHFGFVFQFHFLLPELSVLDKVALPMRQLGRLSAAATRARALDLLCSLDIESEARKTPGSFRAASVSVRRSRGRSPTIRASFSPTNRPARSIRRMAPPYSRSLSALPTRAAR